MILLLVLLTWHFLFFDLVTSLFVSSLGCHSWTILVGVIFFLNHLDIDIADLVDLDLIVNFIDF